MFSKHTWQSVDYPKAEFLARLKILAYFTKIAENQIYLFHTVIVGLIASSNLTTCCHCGRKKSKLSQLCRHLSPAVQFQIEISLEPEIMEKENSLKTLKASRSHGILPKP